MAGTATQGASVLERDAELARIREALVAAGAGRGAALVVEGVAGIGKTALLASAREDAARRGIRVLRARGAQLEADFAFGVVRPLFDPPLAEAGDDERARVLQGPAALAGRLLGLLGAPPVGDGAAAAGDAGF